MGELEHGLFWNPFQARNWIFIIDKASSKFEAANLK